MSGRFGALALDDNWTEGTWSAELDYFVKDAVEALAGLKKAAAGDDLKKIKGRGRLVSQNLNTAEKKRSGTKDDDPYLPKLRAAVETGKKLASAATVGEARFAAETLARQVRALARARHRGMGGK